MVGGACVQFRLRRRLTREARSLELGDPPCRVRPDEMPVHRIPVVIAVQHLERAVRRNIALPFRDVDGKDLAEHLVATERRNVREEPSPGYYAAVQGIEI